MLTAPFYIARIAPSLLFSYVKPTYYHNSAFMAMDYYVYFVFNSSSFSMIDKVFFIKFTFSKILVRSITCWDVVTEIQHKTETRIPRKDYKGMIVMLWQNTEITYLLRGWVSLYAEVMIFPNVFKNFSRELGHYSC